MSTTPWTSLMPQASGSPLCDGVAGFWPSRRSRFGGIEGRQASRGGDSPQGCPLEASAARSTAGAKPSTSGAAKGKARRPKGRRAGLLARD